MGQFQYVHLSEQFYNDYSDLKETMKNPDRQYLHMLTKYKGNTFVIPFRSEIKHKYCFKFKSSESKGLDFSKAVIINDLKYITKSKKNIPQYQHIIIQKKQEFIVRKFTKYVNDYCDAILRKDKNAINRIGQYSTLQNFHKELNLEE